MDSTLIREGVMLKITGGGHHGVLHTPLSERVVESPGNLAVFDLYHGL